MSADTLERPKAAKRPATPADYPSIINLDAVQAYVDRLQRGMTLPAVIPGIQPSNDTDEDGKPIPSPACVIGSDGEVIPGSGAVVTSGWCDRLESKLLSKIGQCVHRTHAMMSRSLDKEGHGVVDPRSQVLLDIPDSELC